MATFAETTTKLFAAFFSIIAFVGLFVSVYVTYGDAIVASVVLGYVYATLFAAAVKRDAEAVGDFLVIGAIKLIAIVGLGVFWIYLAIVDANEHYSPIYEVTSALAVLGAGVIYGAAFAVVYKFYRELKREREQEEEERRQASNLLSCLAL